MYQQFFNFTELPFTIAPDPHFVYMSSRHQEGLAHLLYGINYGGGFVALTGEVGTGKTTLCQCLLRQLPEQVDLALVLNPKLSATDLLATICDELTVHYDKYRQTLKHLVDSLNHYLLAAHAKGRRTVLMIDEAQNLSFSVLEQIRLLTNLETSKDKLLQIILVGQPELQQLLASPKLRQLNQRITARYHLLPLNSAETGAYIQHRLDVSHGSTDIFGPSTIKRIYKLSGGIPRLINLLCDRALLGAYVHNRRKVTVAMINQAAVEIDSQLLAKPRRKRLWIESGALAFSMAAAAFYHWPRTVDKNPLPPESVAPAATRQETASMPSDAAELKAVGEQTAAEATVTEPPVALPDFLETADSSLQQAFSGLLQLWGLAPATTEDCALLAAHCLAGQAGWRELMGLNRPAILEFVNDTGAKRYLLLAGVNHGRPVFQDQDRQIDFSLHQVLRFWQGYYLLLWQPPLEHVDYIYPKQKAASVLWLREQLNRMQMTDDSNSAQADYFDEALQQRLRDFQFSQQIPADGIAGPLTLIHLQNAGSGDYGPKLQIND